MRKRLVGVLFAGLVVAGCGSSGGSPEAGAPAPQPVPKPSESDRKAPAKATDIAEKCGIINPQQQQELGLTNRPPEQRDSNGDLGCKYMQGDLGAPGYGVFVAVNGKSNFEKEVKRHKSSRPEKTEVAGYPVAEVKRSTGCVLYVDTSDQGRMIVNLAQTGVQDAPVDLCQQGKKVTEAALQNIPNA